jgi:hypothetical protein
MSIFIKHGLTNRYGIALKMECITIKKWYSLKHLAIAPFNSAAQGDLKDNKQAFH